MITEVTINLFWILTTFLLIIITFVILAGYKKFLDNNKDIYFKEKDTSITTNLIDKFPLVSPEFMNKSAKEQNIENNQEIHEINKKLEKIQYYLDRLNVHQSMTLDEVKK